MPEPINLDPFDPTVIGPGLAAIPLTPTPWDDSEDGQHAVTADGTVFVRRAGLWHQAAWWQGNTGPEVVAICADPGEWAYGMGWTRKQVEETKGPLTPIKLPGYPHDDDRCRQDSVDAACFREAVRAFAALAHALGLPDTGMTMHDIVQAAIRRIGPTEDKS